MSNKKTARPIFKDFFPESTSVGDIQKLFVEAPELYKYITALDNYIDEVETQDEWIDCSERLPEIIGGKDYSENVFVICDDKLMVMAYCWVESGYHWCNCYGDINGDPEFDDEYKPVKWRTIKSIMPDIKK